MTDLLTCTLPASTATNYSTTMATELSPMLRQRPGWAALSPSWARPGQWLQDGSITTTMGCWTCSLSTTLITASRRLRLAFNGDILLIVRRWIFWEHRTSSIAIMATEHLPTYRNNRTFQSTWAKAWGWRLLTMTTMGSRMSLSPTTLLRIIYFTTAEMGLSPMSHSRREPRTKHTEVQLHAWG